MRRRLLDIMTALSLLLCVAVVALWVSSYRAGIWMSWKTAKLTGTDQGFVKVDLLAERGESAVVVDHRWAHSEEDVGTLIESGTGPNGLRWRRRTPGGMFDDLSDSGFESTAGFAAQSRTQRIGADGSRYTVIMLPLWAVAAALATLAAVSLIRLVPRRVKTLACPACGYNLTGNVSGVCPECGTARQ